jgi:hypothetical protein
MVVKEKRLSTNSSYPEGAQKEKALIERAFGGRKEGIFSITDKTCNHRA